MRILTGDACSAFTRPLPAVPVHRRHRYHNPGTALPCWHSGDHALAAGAGNQCAHFAAADRLTG